MRNLARHSEALVEDMTPIKRTLPSPSPGPSHQSIPAILVCPAEVTRCLNTGNPEGKHVSSQLLVLWAINRLLITLADEEAEW